jgi:hypothetical protein
MINYTTITKRLQVRDYSTQILQTTFSAILEPSRSVFNLLVSTNGFVQLAIFTS